MYNTNKNTFALVLILFACLQIVQRFLGLCDGCAMHVHQHSMMLRSNS